MVDENNWFFYLFIIYVNIHPISSSSNRSLKIFIYRLHAWQESPEKMTEINILIMFTVDLPMNLNLNICEKMNKKLDMEDMLYLRTSS